MQRLLIAVSAAAVLAAGSAGHARAAATGVTQAKPTVTATDLSARRIYRRHRPYLRHYGYRRYWGAPYFAAEPAAPYYDGPRYYSPSYFPGFGMWW